LLPTLFETPFTPAEFRTALTSLARFETRPFIAVAVSGGPDSLALAILADRWARERGGEICALTVDHQLRPESDAEIRRLRGWLAERAIRHQILVWAGEKPASGIQEAARAARYGLLAQWCREHACLHLLAAHHREDQAETHLLRRRAGSAADGLAGMSAIRELADCRVLRPLLGVAKARLAALLDAERQPFIIDPSNRNPAFERSRLRNHDGTMAAGPDLETLLAKIRTLGYGRAARERARDALFARAVTLHPAGFAVLDPGPVLAASHELAEGVLSAVAATVGGGLYPVRRERVARLRRNLAATRKGHTLGGCRFIAWRRRTLVVRELAAAAQPVRLNPGMGFWWDRRFDVTFPSAASGCLTIGYLGQAPVTELNRRALRLGRGSLPRLLHPVLPAVWDADGLVGVPELWFARDRVTALPRIVFRPANRLTGGSFAVV